MKKIKIFLNKFSKLFCKTTGWIKIIMFKIKISNNNRMVKIKESNKKLS